MGIEARCASLSGGERIAVKEVECGATDGAAQELEMSVLIHSM